MKLRAGKPLLLLLIPLVLYGLAKGYLYFSAKQAVDDLVREAAHQADIRYTGIDTELRGAVTVNGITVQPLGYDDSIEIDAIRLSSDDPMAFIRGVDWAPGRGKPPASMAFDVRGVHVPLDSDLVADYQRASGDGGDPCEQPMDLEASMLRKVGFERLDLDFDGHYRIDEARRTLDTEVYIEVHNVQSLQIAASLADLDVETLAQGAAPQINLGGFSVSIRVLPEFGRRLIKACAAGTELTTEQWSERYGARALNDLQAQGVVLGPGLRRAVMDFYRDWGEFRLVSSPAQPVGLLSLMFLPREQLVDALALRLTLNDELITDTSFTLQAPDQGELPALFGEQAAPDPSTAPKKSAPTRIIVRREYQAVPVARVAGYTDHHVRIKPRGQPLREGLLKGIRAGELEIEQTLHGGKYTVYVPLALVESAEVLMQRRIDPSS